MSRRLGVIGAGAALLALTAACGGDSANTNTNANRANTNANAVVTATPTPTPAASAYNRNYNTRDDYKGGETNYRSEARNKGESIGQGLEDGWIHFKTRAALATVDDLRDSTINVDVDNNVVTLRGTVGNAAGKAAAEKAAKGVEGVKSVKNQLTVSSGNSNANGSANANAKSG